MFISDAGIDILQAVVHNCMSYTLCKVREDKEIWRSGCRSQKVDWQALPENLGTSFYDKSSVMSRRMRWNVEWCGTVKSVIRSVMLGSVMVRRTIVRTIVRTTDRWGWRRRVIKL